MEGCVEEGEGHSLSLFIEADQQQLLKSYVAYSSATQRKEDEKKGYKGVEKPRMMVLDRKKVDERLFCEQCLIKKDGSVDE